MRISSNYFTNNFLNHVNSLEQQQNTLQTQASTGLKITNPEDDPSVMSQVLELQTQSSQTSQYQSNITQLQSLATSSGTALNSLQTISNQASEIATEAANGTNSPQQLSAYATQVAQLIQEALQVANTQDNNGNYIFAGTDNSTKPFTATTDASGNVTGVTYNGNTSVAKSEIAPNVTVATQAPGANTSGSGARGVFTDSSSGADLFGNLISLQQNLTAGNTTAISSTDEPALTKDNDNIIYQISANSVMQSTLSNATNIAAAKSLSLTTQISGDTNADLATTLTQLQQTQTAYQAALASGAQVFSLSLLNYLQ